MTGSPGQIIITSPLKYMSYKNRCKDIANKLSRTLFNTKDYKSIIKNPELMLISILKGKKIEVLIIMPVKSSVKKVSCWTKTDLGGKCKCSECVKILTNYETPDEVVVCLTIIKSMLKSAILQGVNIKF